MTENEDGMAPVGGVIAVLRERDYELIDRTLRFWVFRSKNPQSYAFVLPARKLVPVEIVRRALHFEPLDVDAAIERAMVKSASGEAVQYEDHDEPLVTGMEQTLQTLKKFPPGQVKRTPEELKEVQEIMDRFDTADPDDYGPTDASENLDYYIYTPRHYRGD